MDKLTIPIYHKIYTLHEKQIMVDEDLESLHDTTTKRIKEQVKRNSERFPDNFMFQLTEKEFRENYALLDKLMAGSCETHTRAMNFLRGDA